MLRYFQKIISENDDKIIKLENGKILPKARDKKYAELDDKIEASLNEYEVFLVKKTEKSNL